MNKFFQDGILRSEVRICPKCSTETEPVPSAHKTHEPQLFTLGGGFSTKFEV